MKLTAIVMCLLLAANTAAAKVFEFNPSGSTNSGGMLQEVLSRSTKPGHFRQTYANDLATMCHECTHDVNGRISAQLGMNCEGFYLGGGMAAGFTEPRVRILEVAQRVPTQYRDATYYRLYCIDQPTQQPILDRMPLYLIDEWTAAINGAQAAQELGVSDTGDLQMANQMCCIAIALLQTIRERDPSYAELQELDEFVLSQRGRVTALNNGNRQPFVPRTQYATTPMPWRNSKSQQPTTAAKVCQTCYGGQCYDDGWRGVATQPRVIVQQTQPTQPKPAPPTGPTLTDIEKLIDSKLAGVKGCECDHADYVTIQKHRELVELVGILAENTNTLIQRTDKIEQANQSITNTINNLPQPYKPPTPQEQAAAIAPHLKHAATITLLDGTTKTQTKPLSEPLDFIQHQRGLK